VEENVYDFTRMPGKCVKYDEEVVRFNINKVARPKTAIVIAPSVVKPVIMPEKVDFVEKNRQGMREVSRIN
jgi:hypothetical protein